MAYSSLALVRVPSGSDKESEISCLHQVHGLLSNGSAHVIEGVLETGTTYRYKEELAPEGFGHSEAIADNEPVKGARLEIREAQNGDLFDDWTSDGTKIPQR